jgi:tRNA 2-thiocytidine biosynthesis protein TtcA
MNREEEKFIRKLRKKVGRTINKNQLIKGGDRVLIGLSGGKDSLMLADVLAERLKILPVKYEITAVHIHLEGVKYFSDIEYLKNFCESRGIKFIYHKESIDFSGGNKNPCFYCSFNRRRILFEYMKTTNSNKLALGHNMDDAVETLFMNMMFRSRISSLPYALSMFGGEFEIIRPLLEIREEEAKKYVEVLNLKEQQIRCPYENASNRYKVKNLIEQGEKTYPNFVEKVFYSMHRVDNEYLPFVLKDE